MILCAALRVHMPNGETLIVPCHRHGIGMQTLVKLNAPGPIKQEDQGFITTDNVFLNRKDAYQHALESNQLSATCRNYKHSRDEDELYSEDLY